MSSRAQEQNQAAQLAAQFNQFYLDITQRDLTQIGNYRIIKEIGKGTFGKVYLAEHVLLNCQVVLKCGLIDDPNIVREIYYHKQLRHRNVVKLYEVIKTESHLWMAMEYCCGNELYYYIYEKRKLNYHVCQRLFYQIADAMRYVHSLNLAHRDLKLENILMSDKKRTIVKLTDFGFVREFNPYKRLLLSTMCGTPAYMAPEVLKNEKYSGFAVDVWSMGVILYAMVYGQLPFDCDNDLTTKVKIVNEEPMYKDTIPPEVNDIIKKMLSKNPALRPSITEILNSSFLIDTTNYMLERKPHLNITEEESIISINQHYKKNVIPFNSKTEKHLLKKLEKLGVDLESLQAAAFGGQCNSLTAFYDLALTYEFQKKKNHYTTKRRYFDAKRQLKRSSQRVKSVLSLSDQNILPSPTTERDGFRSNSSTKMDLSSIRKSLSRRSAETTKGISLSNGIFSAQPQSTDPAPGVMNRTVSFCPAHNERRSFISKGTNNTNSHGKVKNILEKIVFWKRSKIKQPENSAVKTGDCRRSTRSDSVRSNSIDDGVLELNLRKAPVSAFDFASKANTSTTLLNARVSATEAENSNTVDTSLASPLPPEGSQILKSSSQDSYNRGYRPDSVTSHTSQYSQFSQIYPMSESEFDIGTDVDDDYFDYDGVYESSTNTSQHDLHARTVLQPQNSALKKKNRPSNLRLTSDTLIISQTTNSTRLKRDQLSKIWSNSSEESAVPLKLGDRINDNGTSSDILLPLSNSPGTKMTRLHHPKLHGARCSTLSKSSTAKSNGSFSANTRVISLKSTSNGDVAAPSPIHPLSDRGPRSYSPPLDNSFNKLAINGMTKPLRTVMGITKNSGWQDGGSQGSTAMFGIYEEEEEEEKEDSTKEKTVEPVDINKIGDQVNEVLKSVREY